MTPKFTLARLFGIPIRTGWSTLLIGALISWSLATSIIPWAAPDASTDQAWIGGILGAVLFLASLLAHEMGHALVAKRRGIEVEEVSLWIFGGVAKLRSEPRTPGDEAAVAGAGPAVSAVLAAFGLLAAGISAALSLPMTAAVLGWVGLANALLAVFNLLPGLPLDGGRLLHAALWARSGDRVSSRSTAAQAGRFVGGGIVAIGLFTFAIGSFGGLWTAMVGWFLLGAATQLRRSAKLQIQLGDVTVRTAMRSVPGTVAWYEPVSNIIARSAHDGTRFVFVTGPQGWVTGLIDLDRLGRQSAQRLAGLQADQVATRAGEPLLPFAAADGRLGDALEQSATGSVLAVEQGRVIGMVSRQDAADAAERQRRIRLSAELSGSSDSHHPPSTIEPPAESTMAGTR